MKKGAADELATIILDIMGLCLALVGVAVYVALWILYFAVILGALVLLFSLL